jgi:queuine tRNA-ribosyltransferase
VDRTIAWAKSSKRAFSKFINQKNFTEESRPKIFAVIQGGGFKELRLKCAEALLEIGFDGYGYGGWPLDKNNHLLSDIIGYTREVIPTEFPMHALGVGHPENVLACFNLGYDLFDSAMPTRDARHGRLFTFRNSPDSVDFGFSMPWFEYKYINDEENIKANLPISAYCDCPCCKNYSMGYLYHLFKQGDTLFMRLATLHNLRFMVQLCDRIRRRSD